VARVAAVDLGATSARVAVVDFDHDHPEAEIVHRYPHQPVRAPDGSLRWDWARLMSEVDVGLERAREQGPLASIGVDTWGVDYGLLGDDGQLLSAPYSYRDGRTDAWESLVDKLGPERLYTTTGIQLMALNTVFQLAAHDRAELDQASTLLMLPELVVNHLTGAIAGEVTSAGTSALVDVATGGWSLELLDAIGLDVSLFPPILRAGAAAGTWRDVPVHLVGGHDTASAFVARATSSPGSAVVSAGTWFLVGVERPAPDVSNQARLANFSNEPGVWGGVRFLKNVTGLWLLGRCRAVWGTDVAPASQAGPVFDVNDPAVAAADDTEQAIRAAAGLTDRAERDVVVRCIFDSIAARVARVVNELAGFVDEPITAIDVVGGGGQVAPLMRILGEVTGLEVRVGPAEAAALGNARVQAAALGVV
jgi:rhamnulokinase